MPVLENPKHERFANALVEGMSADAAYAAAGYKPNPGNATRLKRNDSILKRVAELQVRVAERLVIDRVWIINGLVENAEIALGRRKTKKTVKGSGEDPINAEVDVYDRDAAAANAALKLLGQIPEVALFSEVQATEVNVNVTTAPQAPDVDRIAEITKRFQPRVVANNDQPASTKKAAGA